MDPVSYTHLDVYKRQSLNCIVLGEGVTPADPEWDIFIKEIRREMTLKAGQRCTGVRRIFVPENKIEEIWKAIATSIAQTVIGNHLHPVSYTHIDVYKRQPHSSWLPGWNRPVFPF